MKFTYRLSAALVGAAVVSAALVGAVIVSVQQLLLDQKVNTIAKEINVSSIAEEITVRIDGPKAGGSGVIVKREGNDYTVLTNWHVVDDSGDYEIQTADGTRHRVNYRQELSGVDLARLQFTSTQSYRVAELGNSENVSRNQSVYVSGWLNPIPGINQRSYQFIEGKITSLLQQHEDGGYALVYSNIGTYRGMSGGPLLNDRGQVVGINGRAAGDSLTGPVGLYLGIPINFFAFRNTLQRLLALPPVSSETSIFYCGRDVDGKLATLVRTNHRGSIPLIFWVSDYYSVYGFTPKKMCEAASARFQFYHENEMLIYLTTKRVDGYNVICVVESKDNSCGVLFPLKPWDDPNNVLEHTSNLRDTGIAPLYQ